MGMSQHTEFNENWMMANIVSLNVYLVQLLFQCWKILRNRSAGWMVDNVGKSCTPDEFVCMPCRAVGKFHRLDVCAVRVLFVYNPTHCAEMVGVVYSTLFYGGSVCVDVVVITQSAYARSASLDDVGINAEYISSVGWCVVWMRSCDKATRMQFFDRIKVVGRHRYFAFAMDSGQNQYVNK